MVLGVMVEADDSDNERLQSVVDALEEVVELGEFFGFVFPIVEMLLL